MPTSHILIKARNRTKDTWEPENVMVEKNHLAALSSETGVLPNGGSMSHTTAQPEFFMMLVVEQFHCHAPVDPLQWPLLITSRVYFNSTLLITLEVHFTYVLEENLKCLAYIAGII